MIESTTNFYKLLEKDSDFVRCSITFSVFLWNPILWGMGKKKNSMKKDGEHLIKLFISFPNFS